MADKEFLETPLKVARAYSQHLIFVALDGLFLLGWALLVGGCHVGLGWVIENIGMGPVDHVTKWLFEAAFSLITFYWLIRTVWAIHKNAHAPPRRIRRRADEPKPK